MTKNDKQMMICVLQDLSGSIEILVFGKAYDAFSSKLVEDKVVIIDGRLSIKEDMSRSSDDDEDSSAQLSASIVLNDLTEVEGHNDSSTPEIYIPRDEYEGKSLIINFRAEDGVNFNRCVDTLVSSRGNSPVFFRFIDKHKQGRFSKCDVRITAPLISELKGILGNDGVEIR